MNGASIPPKREGVCAACECTFPGPRRGPIAALCPPCKRERQKLRDNFRSAARPEWRSENGRASMALWTSDQRRAAGRAGAAGRWAGHEAAPKRVRLPDIKCPYCPDLMRPWRKQCGKPLCLLARNADRNRKFVSDYAKRYPEKRRARRSLRRALEKGAQRGEMVFPVDIFARDGWLCRLCGGDVPRDAQFPDPLSATIDHVVPVIRGGPHTNDNVQLAHLHCNCSAGAKVDAA